MNKKLILAKLSALEDRVQLAQPLDHEELQDVLGELIETVSALAAKLPHEE